MSLADKYQKLRNSIKQMKRVVVGFSGGVDSTFLLKVAHDVLGDDAIALTVKSNFYPEELFLDVEKLAKEINAPLRFIEVNEFKDKTILKNPPDRCYYCKKEIFLKISEWAKKEGIETVVDGSNYDDLKDYRPGMKALKELNIRSPLLEAGLTKAEIRELSRKVGLSTWNKPSFTCLATRIPYGNEITKEKLEMIKRAERSLTSYNLKQLRIRHHDDKTARIEVSPEDIPVILDNREEITRALEEVGYIYITLDLKGYRSGSLNEILKKE